MMLNARQLRCHWPKLILAALFGLLLLMLCAIGFGALTISPINIAQVFVGQGAPKDEMIVLNLRVPRVLLGALVGALLAMSGALAQGLFRNPLADPSLIGVGAGSTLGASIAIVLLGHISQVGFDFLSLSLMSFCAFCGGVFAVLLVYAIATDGRRTSVITMLLVGIGITFLAGSATNILMFIADNEQLRQVSLWQMGGLDTAGYERVFIALAVFIIFISLLPKRFVALNAFLLGESEARHLGVVVDREKKLLMVMIAAGVGTSVALAGAIAFIGLIVPHMMRLVVGPNHRFLVPMCGFVGATLLILADIIARTLIAPTEIPVGVITSLIGAPLFIALLHRRYRYVA